MSGAGLPGGVPTDAAALAALQAQARRLERVAARLAPMSTGLSPSAEAEWQGPARTAFDMALSRLRVLVSAASGSVEEALAETRRAIGTMGGGE